jgi:3-dehydro-L-gulonate 2-dehydrogenase
MKRIPFETMKEEIKRVLLSVGMSEEKANICAQIHSESSADGIYSHGLAYSLQPRRLTATVD